jgi:hypothetical protein
MYKIEETQNKAAMVATGFTGAGFTQDEADRADTMETWGSSFSDPGPDFSEFRLIADGCVIATKCVAGY